MSFPDSALEQALARVLDRWPTISAAWLFGSMTTGTDGPLSDVDVAILGWAGLTFDDRAQLTVELTRGAG